MPGARCTRSRACSVESTRVSHHGRTGITRHSRTQWFTAYFVLSPVIGLCCHRHPCDAKHHHELDASVEASGPHDFAVRKITRSSVAHPRPSHPNPTFVTIAKRPLCVGRDANDIEVIWVKRECKYFCGPDWTGQIMLIRRENFFSGVIPNYHCDAPQKPGLTRTWQKLGRKTFAQREPPEADIGRTVVVRFLKPEVDSSGLIDDGQASIDT
jgi:hypothetical protein